MNLFFLLPLPAYQYPSLFAVHLVCMVKTTGFRPVVAAFVTGIVCHAFAQDIDLNVACSSQYNWVRLITSMLF